MKPIGKSIFWGVAALLAITAIALTFRADPVWVDVATVSRGPLEVTITEEGRTRVQDRYVVSSPVAGYLHRVELEVGDQVIPGELLVEIEPMPASALDARSRGEALARVAAAESALKSSQQQVDAAHADAQLAQNEYARLEKLIKTEYVSRDRLQQAETVLLRSEANLRSARFNAEVAQHELAAARTRLDVSAARLTDDGPLERVAVRSPINGAVLQVIRKSEGVVQAGNSLIEIGDPGALEVVVEVLSFDAVKLAPEVTVRLTGWGGTPLTGQVLRVEPVGFEDISALGVEEQRVQVIVGLGSPRKDWSTLGDGYRVDATFVLWRGDDVVQAPASAIFQTDDGPQVFVVNSDNLAQQQAVEVGYSNGLMTEIRSGLAPGDTVIRHPDAQLSEGVRIRVR